MPAITPPQPVKADVAFFAVDHVDDLLSGPRSSDDFLKRVRPVFSVAGTVMAPKTRMVLQVQDVKTGKWFSTSEVRPGESYRLSVTEVDPRALDGEQRIDQQMCRWQK